MLSVLLPVHNAHHQLERGVHGLLDVLSELAPDFELLVLDDGSSDESADVAYDLAAQYPQIRVTRHPVPLGLAEAIQTGMDQTTSEVLLLNDDFYDLDPTDLRMLWQLRDIERTASAEARSLGNDWLTTLRTWKSHRWAGRGGQGFHAVTRSAFEQYRLEQAAQATMRIDRDNRRNTRPNFLEKAKRFVRGE